MLCTDGDYAAVIEKKSGRRSVCGNFTDTHGNVMGQHKGIIHYTLGQRKGLGITFGRPMYVCGINPEDNTVVLGEEWELFSSEAYVS